MKREFDDLNDEQLERAYQKELRYHDGLIDSADMGDERIYFSGKLIDRMRAELDRRRNAG
jgi:hypothetical protein